MPRTVSIVGVGRAGGAFAHALPIVGWQVAHTFGRGDDPTGAADGVDLVLIATQDAAISEVSQRIESGDGVVAHVAGSLGLDVFASHHKRRAALHPLMALPDAAVGSERLRSGGWFATAGDELVDELVVDLGGRFVHLADGDRAVYHATAVVASNHLTALLGQVERLAASIDMPVEPFLDLAAGSMDAVRRMGAADALTGPAARGDHTTLERHLAALPDDERETYRAMMQAALRLAASTPIAPPIAPKDIDADR